VSEGWQQELRKLRALELSDGIWERAQRGSSTSPERPARRRVLAAGIALAVFAGAGAVAWIALRQLSRPANPSQEAANLSATYRDPQARWSFRHPSAWRVQTFRIDCGHVQMEGVYVSNHELPPPVAVITRRAGKVTDIGCSGRPRLRSAARDTVVVEILELLGGPARPESAGHVAYPLSLGGAKPYALHPRAEFTVIGRELPVDGLPIHVSVIGLFGDRTASLDRGRADRIVSSIRFADTGSNAGTVTASPGYIPPGFTKQVSESGRSRIDPQDPGLTLDTEPYIDPSVPAVLEIDVVQGGSSSAQRTVVEDVSSHPDARQITVQGHPAWLLPVGPYSGLVVVEWAYDGARVSVVGRGVDEATMVRVAEQLQLSHTLRRNVSSVHDSPAEHRERRVSASTALSGRTPAARDRETTGNDRK